MKTQRMMPCLTVALIMSLIVTGSFSALGETITWTNAGGDNRWNNPSNWASEEMSAGKNKNSGPEARINMAGEDRAIVETPPENKHFFLHIGRGSGQTGELEINKAFSKSLKTHHAIGRDGGTGIVHQNANYCQGWRHLKLGTGGEGSRGEWVINKGRLNVACGALVLGDNNCGTGKLNVTGGSLNVRYHVGIHNGSTFRVAGSLPVKIEVGGASSWGWQHHTGGVVQLNIDRDGITPIELTKGVKFAEGAVLDLKRENKTITGVWDVMRWNGKLQNNGLKLADSVDTDAWDFSFVDTNDSGSEDTLRVYAHPLKPGKNWTNLTEDNDWNNPSNWQVGGVPGTEDVANVNLSGPAMPEIDDAQQMLSTLIGWDADGALDLVKGARVSFAGFEGQAIVGRGEEGKAASGTMKLAGGVLVTRMGLLQVGACSTFYVAGSDVEEIGIGSKNDPDWSRRQSGTLRAGIDAGGLTTVLIDGGGVSFKDGARLDVGFLEDSERVGSWDVITWDGDLTGQDHLAFANTVDTATWNFNFVDTDDSGKPDTLRVSVVPHQEQRIASVRKLSGDVPEKAVSDLVRVLKAETPADQLAAVDALKNMGPKAAKALSSRRAEPALKVIKSGAYFRFSINGMKVLEWDDPAGDTPILEGGKIGFRQMRGLIADYVNLQVRRVERK